jgi:hypothetical protein
MTVGSIDNNCPCGLRGAIEDHLPLVEGGQLLIARTWDVSWLFLDCRGCWWDVKYCPKIMFTIILLTHIFGDIV